MVYAAIITLQTIRCIELLKIYDSSTAQTYRIAMCRLKF